MAAEHPDSLSDLEEKLAAAEREIERQAQIIDALQHRLFGKKSERINPDQYQLEFGEEVLGKCEPPTSCESEDGPEADDEDGSEAETNGRTRPRRKKADIFPRNLPVIIKEVLVPEEVKEDPEAWTEIGEEAHDTLAVVKPKIYWERIISKRFKCKDDRSRPPVIAPAPEPSVPGTKVDAGLIAMIIADKYVDHLPHYRQSARFLRQLGVRLGRQTINGWTHAAADFLSPIGEAILAELQESDALQIDETPMAYLSPGSGKIAQGYFWYYRDPESGLIYCDWQLGRGHESMFNVLRLDEEDPNLWFTGDIQCDGYSAYVALTKRYEEIQLHACLAHIRRKFYEARKQAPEVILPILRDIAIIYRYEKGLRVGNAPPDCKELVRRSHSREIAQRLKEKILTERKKHLPKSKLGEAIGYALGQWGEFERCLEDGRFDVDNNQIENAIRPAKLGLKNYLFLGSAETGKSSALLYTLVGNCKSLGIDPERYLALALDRMKLSTTAQEAAPLTPARLAEEVRATQLVPSGDEGQEQARRRAA